MSKPVLKSDRSDVRALDEVFNVLRGMGHDATVRVLRFFCESQGIRGSHLFPQDYRNV